MPLEQSEILGNRFVTRGARNDAWHRLGTNREHIETVEEAMAITGMDYKVVVVGNNIPLPDGTSMTSNNSYSIVRNPLPKTNLKLGNGDIMDEVNQILRGHDAQVDGNKSNEFVCFGTSSKIYEIMQNSEFFKSFEPVVKEWPIETAGILKDGRIAWMLFNLGTDEVTSGPLKGDAFTRYVSAINFFEPGKSSLVQATDTRIVCNNTLRTSIGKAKWGAKVKHRKGAMDDLSYALENMANVVKASQQVRTAFEMMSQRILTALEVENFLKECFREPAKPKQVARIGRYGEKETQTAKVRYDWKMQNVEKTRSAVKLLFEQENDTAPAGRGSAYLLYNAVCEHADFNWETDHDNHAASSLFGERSLDKIRAFDMAMALSN